MQYVVALGNEAARTIETFCRQIAVAPPRQSAPPKEEEALFWARGRNDNVPIPVKLARPRQSHNRHTSKYAEGELEKDENFVFRGPEGKLNLRAHNLTMFTQMAEGVDEGTWEHHRNANDYSAWFRRVIKDDALAQEARSIEVDRTLDADESRRRILEAVARRYTAPARAHRSA